MDILASVFASLLGAAKHYADYELAEELVKSFSALEPDNPISFVILSNIYAKLGKRKDVERIRNIKCERKLRQLPSYSMIGV